MNKNLNHAGVKGMRWRKVKRQINEDPESDGLGRSRDRKILKRKLAKMTDEEFNQYLEQLPKAEPRELDPKSEIANSKNAKKTIDNIIAKGTISSSKVKNYDKKKRQRVKEIINSGVVSKAVITLPYSDYQNWQKNYETNRPRS